MAGKDDVSGISLEMTRMITRNALTLFLLVVGAMLFDDAPLDTTPLDGTNERFLIGELHKTQRPGPENKDSSDNDDDEKDDDDVDQDDNDEDFFA